MLKRVLSLVVSGIASALFAEEVQPAYCEFNLLPGDTLVMTNTEEYVESKIGGAVQPDFSTNNTVLVETIEAVAPAPKNYLAVSNAAMNALSMTDATNVVGSIVTNTVQTWRKVTQSEWDMRGNPVYEGNNTWYADFEGNDGIGPAWADGPEGATLLRFRDGGEGEIDVSYERCVYNALGLAMAVDLNGKASTNDIHLVSVYGKWICNPKHIPAEDLIEEMQSFAPNGITPYVAYANAAGEEITLGGSQIPTWMAVRPYPFTVEWNEEGERLPYDPEAKSITTFSRIIGRSFTASRTIIGYTLGSQTNKVLASTNLESGVSAAVVSNIAEAVVADATTSNRYPLFIIDLNPGEARRWQHVELKATTNNFENDGMTFFTGTTDNGIPNFSNITHDWCRVFIASKRADTDIRKWQRITCTGDLLGYAPLTLAIIVDPSSEFLRREASKADNAAWLYEGNTNLIWSYSRLDGNEHEQDQDGRQCWRMIMPTKWYAELPAWADVSAEPPDSTDIVDYVDPWLKDIEDANTTYQRFEVVTNINQSVQFVTHTPNNVLNIEMPIAPSSSTKDWVMYCNFVAETSIHLPSATWWMADAAYTNAIPANQPTALYFTQVTDGVYMLSRQELTTMLIQE